MSWKLIVPPTGLAISLAEAQFAARADVDEEGASPLDEDIAAAVKTYTAEAEGVTNRAIMEQTWRLTLDEFSPLIELLHSPLLQVEHVRFYAPDPDVLGGVLRTLDPQDYFTRSSEPAQLMPAPGRSWPSTAVRADAVEIQIRCGYGADHTSVPDSIKGFIRARVAEQFAANKHADNPNVARLLWPEVVHL